MRRREVLIAGTGLLASGAFAKPAKRVDVVEVGGAKLRVVIGDSPPVSRAMIHAWVHRAASMVSDYLGRFPVPTLKVEIVTGGYGGLGWGQHFRGRRLEIHAGERTTRKAIRKDWVMVHEMLHCGYPWLAKKHKWMREGLSTYLETVVRAEAGVVSERYVWERWTGRMHHGLPGPGDRGYDITRSWGSTYWGGALYWLLADVRIRQETKGERTLREALRAILEDMGSSRTERKIGPVLAVGDRATGTGVLTRLYGEMGLKPAKVDLPALWKQLGVEVGPPLGFLEDAPLAKLRADMSRPRHRLIELPPV